MMKKRIDLAVSSFKNASISHSYTIPTPNSQKKKRKRKKSAEGLASAGKNLSPFPVLEALAEREELVRNGKLSVSYFFRVYSKF